MLYRLSRDGASLNTLLLRSKKYGNCLLVIKDREGTVFGGLITEQLKVRQKYSFLQFLMYKIFLFGTNF